jgi:hypothetical protein
VFDAIKPYVRARDRHASESTAPWTGEVDKLYLANIGSGQEIVDVRVGVDQSVGDA